jgi:hypothetical protein
MRFAGGPGETAYIAKPAIQQIFYQPRSDESGSACHQDGIILPNYEIVANCLAHYLAPTR